jgi:hypothetical protein
MSAFDPLRTFGDYQLSAIFGRLHPDGYPAATASAKAAKGDTIDRRETLR